ncbi:hypothetical protein SKAU_G00417980 [Synaphobranchus kaupii]|uniref:Uncharacterized protein n=1 Tax=Synaphobranchus kaupii TaxID=118154 RepID=A0A9Q1E647_SYNKA|nr:hypothetical protein SKAU_G00417980 [Synaphobranchus kaupii]
MAMTHTETLAADTGNAEVPVYSSLTPNTRDQDLYETIQTQSPSVRMMFSTPASNSSPPMQPPGHPVPTVKEN